MQHILNRQPKQDEVDEKFLNTFILEQRSEELRKSLELKRKDIIKEFFSCFIKHDKEKTRTLTLRKVFQEIINADITPFAVILFGLFNETVCSQDCQIQYDNLFYSIASFCLFETKQMLKLLFYKKDDLKKGYIFEEDVMDFLIILHGVEGCEKKSMRKALGALKYRRRNGSTSFKECLSWCKEYSCVLEPCFTLQAKFRESFLGMRFWENQVLKQYKMRQNVLPLEERRELDRQNEEQRLLRERNRRIREEMGLLSYLFDRRRRDYMESVYTRPNVYLNEDLEVCNDNET